MNDRILEAYIKDFAEQYNLETVEQSKLFEMFVNYCVISRHYPETFSLEDIGVGGGDDTALDGLAILVNGRLVTTKEEIDYLRKTLGAIDIVFILVQSKTSANFNGGEIGNFLFGAKSFFQKTPSIPENEEVARLRGLKEHIYDLSIHMSRNPTCQLYYVTTGEWKDAAPLVGRIKDDVETLEATKLFNRVDFSPIDAARLKQIYQELSRKTVKEIEFPQHTILPKLDGVRQAYIGILPCSEYLKLICDSDGNLQQSVFYDNIRDYQGDNPVNIEIAATIRDEKQQERLPILNNGITIVAKSISQTGATFKMQDYQIVNGCQTSHVLYNHRNSLAENASLTVKLIETADPDVTNLIIKATNRQTEVKVEAFEALSPFHKRLEEFYASFDRDKTRPKLYYERRSKQYDDVTIKRYQVVTIAGQIKSFISVFLDEPQSTHRYYGELLKSYSNRIFQDKHNLYPYYISSLLIYRLEQLIREGEIASYLRPFKYHMAMLYRLYGPKTPSLSSRKDMEQFCERLCTSLIDNNLSKGIFENCGRDIREVLREKRYRVSDAVRVKSFTSEIQAKVIKPS